MAPKKKSSAAQKFLPLRVLAGKPIFWGGISGFLAGGVIGIILFFSGAIPEIVQKFGAANEGVALFAHLFASTVLGTIFGAIFGKFQWKLWQWVSAATAFSMLSWILAMVIVKPIRFGIPFGEALSGIFGEPNIFIGHGIFGVILGVIFWGLASKLSAQK